ncbi:siderophore-interacting protein [Rhodococcus sp. NPDC127528]|uniref:siderophore-interacting protein n=1 Tax=unclassified Rhodococcus (in: high G+C Gram-positive bacteria) TaxID=192944 RepID=UPI0036457F48
MAKRSKFVKPEHREFIRTRVLASKQISPNFVRVTVGGEELRGFTPLGFDQWFRMFVPQAGASALRLPSATSNLWYAQYLAMSKGNRPVVRNYTVRAYRPADRAQHGDTPELDIDFVCHGADGHGDPGPASIWANGVAPGDEMALLDEGLIYNPAPTTGWQLLVGDESALPAIAGILGSAAPTLRAEVFIEVPHADDAQDLGEPEGVRVHWLVRGDSHARPGVLALETVRAARWPDAPSYAFVAGESDLATGVRRHLVSDRGVAKADIAFTGFWRFGKSAP